MIEVMRKLLFFLGAIVSVVLSLLAGCGGSGRETAEPTPSSSLATETHIVMPRMTNNLPEAPEIPIPTAQTLPPGTRIASTATLPATATMYKTPTRSPSPIPTSTPTPSPKVNVIIVACDTGIDLFNQLGEVTNAYVIVQNVGPVDVNEVRVNLAGSDEEKTHPDQSYQIDHLPAGYEIALKLTVDTKNGQETSIQVEASGDEGEPAYARKDSCRSRRPDQDILSTIGKLFEARKMEDRNP